MTSSWRTLFPNTVAESALSVVSATSSVGAIDLRSEFTSLIMGSSDDIPIGQTLILRRMRRDSSDARVPCLCLDETYHEPDIDFPCSSCQGAGYLWDEEIIYGYRQVAAATSGSNAAVNFDKSEVGSLYVPATKFYFLYDANLKREDIIVDIELDVDGAPVLPYNRIGFQEVNLVRSMRSDNGRIEFWVCDTQRTGPKTHGYQI